MILGVKRRWLHHIAVIGVMLLVVMGVAQAAHIHGPDFTGSNHCSTCVASHAPAAPLTNAILVIHTERGTPVVLKPPLFLCNAFIGSSYIRPPPAL